MQKAMAGMLLLLLVVGTGLAVTEPRVIANSTAQTPTTEIRQDPSASKPVLHVGEVIDGRLGLSGSNLYYKAYGQSNLMQSNKTGGSVAITRSATWQDNYQSGAAMDQKGNWIVEWRSYNYYIRKHAAVAGTYTDYYTSYYPYNEAVGCDSLYIYKHINYYIYKFRLSDGAYINQTYIYRYYPTYHFGVANDTLWDGDGSSYFYAYPTSALTGGYLSYTRQQYIGYASASWMNITWDGTYYYIASGGYSSNTMRRYPANWGSYTDYTVAMDMRSVMAVSVRLAHDVGIAEIRRPSNVEQPWDEITPRCKLQNFGTNSESNIPVSCRVTRINGGSTVYTKDTTIAGPVAAGDTVGINWPILSLGPEDSLNVRFYTSLSGDLEVGNDTMKLRTDVKWGNWIIWDDGTWYNAYGFSYNYGPGQRYVLPVTGPARITRVMFWHYPYSGYNYAIRILVVNKGTGGSPGTTLLDTAIATPVANWNTITINRTVTVQDTFFVFWVCNNYNYYPYIGGDAGSSKPSADYWFYSSGSFYQSSYGTDWMIRPEYMVQLHDYSARGIIAPTSAVDSGATVTPQAKIQNRGSLNETNVPVRFDIGTYTATANVSLNAGDSTTVSFNPNWVAGTRGSFAVKCSTQLTGDGRAANNKVAGTVAVNVHDVAALAIEVPATDTLLPGAVIPQVKVSNYGTLREPVKAYLTVNSSPAYSDSVVLAGGLPFADTSLVFASWTAPIGNFTMKCSVALAGDQVPANNVLSRNLVVKTPLPPGWWSKTRMPTGAKFYGDGGWIAYNDGDEKIYAARGNKQSDFFSYNPAADSWTSKLGWPLGIEAKGPGKGSFGTADGNGKIYAAKGNGTQGWWLYDAAKDSWYQKANVPLGPTNKKVKGGTGLVYVDNTVYMLKGYKNEFWRYFPDADTWHQLVDAPTGINLKWDKGSWLAYDPVDNKIYAHKAKYHEFYTFDPVAETWSAALKAMPTINPLGKSKKSKDGGSGALHGRNIYAFKGGNTQEFWKYYIVGDSWAWKETIPQIGTGSLKKKKVKGGGSLATVGDQIYGMKGNKCDELWVYQPGSFLYGRSGNEGVMAEQLGGLQAVMTVSPNPMASGFATVRYSLPLAGPATVRVLDVTGRSLVTRTVTAGRSGGVTLDLRDLSNGVYLVKFSAEGFTATHKLVVQR